MGGGNEGAEGPASKKLELHELKRIVEVEVGNHLPLEVSPGTIPIILVPDTFATRLANEEGQQVWEPDATGFSLFQFGMVWHTALDKKRKLVGVGLKPLGEERWLFASGHEDRFAQADATAGKGWPSAAERGWGEVSWDQYGELLQSLQASAGWGGKIRFEFPVYAFGYDWTYSLRTNGAILASRIRKILKAHDREDRPCRKVILVTHGAGGIVARWALETSGTRPKVLGVIHASLPAQGAAAWYWRFKAGFERPPDADKIPDATLWVLGAGSTLGGTAKGDGIWTKFTKLGRGGQASAEAVAEVIGGALDMKDAWPLEASHGPDHEQGRLARFGEALKEDAKRKAGRIQRAALHPQRYFGAILGAWELGTNGEEVTAVYAFMPGILEQLPSRHYRDNHGKEGWLRVCGNDGKVLTDGDGKRLEFGGDDVWEQIYRCDDVRKPWRLINQQFLVPHEKGGAQGAAREREVQAAWTEVRKLLSDAERDQRLLEDIDLYEEIQAFCGAGTENPTADAIVFRVSPPWYRRPAEVVREVADFAVKFGLGALLAFAIAPDPFSKVKFGLDAALWVLQHTAWWQLRGGFKTRFVFKGGQRMDIELVSAAELEAADRSETAKEAELGASHGEGDGYVPTWSGQWAGQQGDALPAEGKLAKGEARRVKLIDGLEHDRAFSRERGALEFTLGAVGHLVDKETEAALAARQEDDAA